MLLPWPAKPNNLQPYVLVTIPRCFCGHSNGDYAAMPSCPSVKMNLEQSHFIFLCDASLVIYFVNVREPSATVCQNATSIRASSTTWCQDAPMLLLPHDIRLLCFTAMWKGCDGCDLVSEPTACQNATSIPATSTTWCQDVALVVAP